MTRPEDPIGFAPDAIEVRREPGEHLAGITDREPLELVGERAEVADEDGAARFDLRDDVGGIET